MENLIWVLGTSDPEMEAIESLLRECGQSVTYATIDGRRVTPAEAYKASVPYYSERIDAHGIPCDISGDEPVTTRRVAYDGREPLRWAGATIVRVECSWAGASGPVCDHHNPGDPGYGRPPAEYWDASSIGQVVAMLAARLALPSSWEEYPGQMESEGIVRYWVPASLKIVAAADHCLAAAYRGECPDVDSQQLMVWRVMTRAKFQNRRPEDVLADVHKAMEALRAAPEVVLDSGGPTGAGPEHGYDGPDRYPDVTARDMRGVHVQELPEAAARLGVCFISEAPAGRDGRVKVVCQSGTPEQIDAFMRVFGPSIGLVDIYGDPARGFAGGYHPAAK